MSKQEEYAERLLDEIKWRRGRNGLYFSHFDTEEEAAEWLAQQAVRYRYSEKLNLSKIVEEAKEKGIIIHNTRLSNWFKKHLNLTVNYKRPQRVFDKDHWKKPSTISLTKEMRKVLEPLGKYHMKSWWIETIIRANTGMEMENVVVWIGDGAVVFYDEGNDIRCIHLHWLPKTTIQLLQSWCSMAQESEGLYTISHLARTYGFKTRGFDDDTKDI